MSKAVLFFADGTEECEALLVKRTASPLTPKTEFLLTAGALRAGDAPPAVRFFFDL